MPRRLTEAEIELWLAVARSVLPRPGSSLPTRAKPKAEPRSVAPAPEPAPPQPYRRAANSYSPPLSVPKPKAPPLAPFERRFLRKVAGGRVEIDAVLDLHGMTQAQAHAALHSFLLREQRGGARLVMVVTGKGRRGDPENVAGERTPGVLRRSVPHWLRDPVLRSIVLGFEEAAAGHGGAGALYVRLRRREGDA
jgi:DNA-nicking Smr family endonuclease